LRHNRPTSKEDTVKVHSSPRRSPYLEAPSKEKKPVRNRGAAPVVNATGAVDPELLELIREPLRDAGAKPVLEAIDRYDRVVAVTSRLVPTMHEARRRLELARQSHRAQVVAELAAGRRPDDVAAREAVEQAEADLVRAKAHVDAIPDARRTAGLAVRQALGGVWPDVLPWLARRRTRHPDDPALHCLAHSITWPALHTGPGRETPNTHPSYRFGRWWPLSIGPPVKDSDPAATLNGFGRSEWNEWAWGELAERRFDLERNELSFIRDWTGPETRFGEPIPVTEVSAASVAAYAEQKQNLRGGAGPMTG
jgi:hypothetical protein